MLGFERSQFVTPKTPGDRYEVKIGRDFFIDRYFDTDDFTLTKNRMLARARMRGNSFAVSQGRIFEVPASGVADAICNLWL